MKRRELIEKIRKGQPKALLSVTDRQAAQVLQAAYETIKESLSAAPEGKFPVQGLGLFVVRSVEREVQGEKNTRTRILFVPAAAGAGKARKRPKPGQEGAA